MLVATIVGHLTWVLVPHRKRDSLHAMPPPPSPPPQHSSAPAARPSLQPSPAASHNASSSHRSFFQCGVPGRQPVVVVDTYLPVDTGGPEALVQLAIASQAAYPGRTVVWRKRVHSRMWIEYGARGFRELPAVHGDPESFMCPGDVLIQPDVRAEACSPWLVERNVTLFTYVLSINFLPLLLRAASRHPHHCRFLSHSHALAGSSSLWHSSPTRHRPASVVRPYITPSLAASCAATRVRPARRRPFSDPPPLVLLDSDSPGEVRYLATAACNLSSAQGKVDGGTSKGSATTAAVTTTTGERALSVAPLCRVVWVHHMPRSHVKTLLEEASIVVDMCMVGLERLPIEAALCGAVLITSSCRKGHGTEARDFPLPAGSILTNASQLATTFRRVLARFEDERRGMQRLVQLYDSSAQDGGSGSGSGGGGGGRGRNRADATGEVHEEDADGPRTEPASAQSMARELRDALRDFMSPR